VAELPPRQGAVIPVEVEQSSRASYETPKEVAYGASQTRGWGGNV
jgi:hypothetical protein